MPGLELDLHTPWLDVPPHPDYLGCVLVNRTSRYRNNYIHYGSLRNRPDVYFLGLTEEATAMRQELGAVPHIQAADFLELASIIKACRLFVGNQSFCYHLAEAMKVPRILEVSTHTPNVQPHGAGGYDAFDQRHLG